MEPTSNKGTMGRKAFELPDSVANELNFYRDKFALDFGQMVRFLERDHGIKVSRQGLRNYFDRQQG